MLLFTIAVLTANLASADEPIMVDPHDFTRTPCEYRRSPCPAYSTQQPESTDNTVLDSGRVTLTLATGAVIEATVYLISISPRGKDAVIEKRVLVEYESGLQEMRSDKTREAVFGFLTSVAEEYGVDRTDVAACRPVGKTCQVTSFARDGEWARIR